MNEKNVKITAIAYGGKGLARLEEDGKIIPVFVENAVPGDELTIRIVGQNKRYVEATIVKITKPSDIRIHVICPHFEKCGGCQFLNMGYDEQLQYKTEMIKAVLERNNKGIMVNDMIPSKKHLYYRLRVRYKVISSEKGLVFGFCKPRTNDLVDIKKCFITEEIINDVANQIKKDILGKIFGKFEIEIIKNASKEEVYVKVDVLHGNDDVLIKFKEMFSKNKNIVGYAIDKKLYKHVVFTINNLQYGPECFTQINAEQNKKIIDIVLEEAKGKVLDLYCGIGNYTIPLAETCESVVGVEGSKDSCKFALINAEGKKNVTIINKRVEQFLNGEQQEYDTVIVNPSRRSEPIEFKVLNTKKIVYVSCNPEQLSRDIKQIIGLGFTIKYVQPVDMFPQTYHVETVVVFEK